MTDTTLTGARSTGGGPIALGPERDYPLFSRIRASVLLSGFLVLVVLMMPVQWFVYKFKLPWRSFVPFYFHKFLCWFLGVKVHTHGEQVTDRAVLVTANHSSYFDIPILSSRGKVSFIAKKEVADWPLFGMMARLQDTVFVDRSKRSKTGANRQLIQKRLKRGQTLVLFPEGTSSDGIGVLPFKSALMGAAEPAKGPEGDDLPQVTVQPVSIAYTRVHGIPMGRQFRPFFAWYGDMELIPHLWESFRLGPFDVDVHYHPPVQMTDFKNRKELAAYCHKIVAAGVGHALSGRPGAVGPWHEERKRPFDGDELGHLPGGIFDTHKS